MGEIRHVFSNAIADGTNTDIVRPIDWNSGHNYTMQDAVSLAGNTAGALANISSGTLYLAGGNNVTLSQDANSVTISGPHTSQFITTAMASNRGSDFVQATAAFAGTSASGTIASGGISVSIGPYITTAALSNHSHGVTAGNGGFNFQTLSFSNANGVSFGTSAGSAITASHNALTTAMASNRGSDFVQANAAFHGTNASGTIASNAISVSVDAGGGGLTNIRLSAGTTSNLASAFTVADSNGISFGLNAGTLTATVKTDYLTTAALSNHSHGNPQLNLTNLSGTTASASNGFTLSLSAAAPGAGGGATLNFWQNMEAQAAAFPLTTINITGAERTFIFQPLCADFGPFKGNITVSTLMMPMNLSGSTATMSATHSSSFSFGFYTLNAGTLSLVNSCSTSFGFAAAATNNSTLYAGSRWLTMGTGAWSSLPVFSADVQYWWGFAFRSSGRLNQTFSIFGQNIWASNSTFVGTIGAASVANNTTQGIAPFYGVYSATSNAVPVSIGSNQLNKQVSTAGFIPMIRFNNITASF